MEPHWATLRRYSPERAFEQIVAPQWEAFCGDGFERLCREALPLLYVKEGVSGHFDVGEYWDRAVQIDVVGLRAGVGSTSESVAGRGAWQWHKLPGSWQCGRRIFQPAVVRSGKFFSFARSRRSTCRERLSMT